MQKLNPAVIYVNEVVLLMELKAKEVLDSNWVCEYEKRIAILSQQLTEIRTTLFILKRIAQFPFHLFGEYNGPFWDIVIRSTTIAIIVGVYRIVYDKRSEVLTVDSLRKQVMEHLKKSEAKEKDRIERSLKEKNVEDRQNTIKKRINCLRNQFYGHLNADVACGVREPMAQPSVLLSELEDITEAVHELINAVGFETYYETIHPDYDPNVHPSRSADPKSDIERILDDMVLRCEDFRLPEEKPYEFTFYWKHLSSDERHCYNYYRRKFDLPEIKNG